jgi:hypothetical protein
VPQLALDDVERDALASQLERVGVAQLVRHEAAPNTGNPASCRTVDEPERPLAGHYDRDDPEVSAA